jgi:hypothetical protein
MSFGIGPSVHFELGMASRGHNILMFDHTVEELPEKHPRFTWFREGVASHSEPERGLFTLAVHMEKLPSRCDGPILKLDIEGYEWDVLDTVPIDFLLRFEQIALELHGLERLEEPAFNSAAQKILEKLTTHFTLCHVHANNFNIPRVLAGCFLVPGTLELSYIRSDLVTRALSTTIYPTALDAPNYHQFPDVLLWYFPFLPGSEALKFPMPAE